ncbi:MAG: Rieske 2Fe-2S domain-containing protein [Jatrophihabitantaceae bacterium]
MSQPWGPRTQDAGWLLLPVRAFLALVFLYGGISKIADPRFLDASSPLSMHASVSAIRGSSPIGGLLGVVQDHSFAFGILMAAGELAVGLGLLLGLFTRVAAAGGMLLALSLWLTVSWGASLWFTSADLVYLFALTPLLIAGARVYSVDAWLDHVREIQPGAGEDRTRRSLIGGGVGILGAVALGSSALLRPSRRTGRQQRLDTGPTPQALTRTADVPVGGAKMVTVASIGEPVWVLQLAAGDFTAYDAICPHQGCTVEFVSAADGFACPCHQSRFTAQGQRIDGPAPRGLASIPVTVQGEEVRTT